MCTLKNLSRRNSENLEEIYQKHLATLSQGNFDFLFKSQGRSFVDLQGNLIDPFSIYSYFIYLIQFKNMIFINFEMPKTFF